METFGNEEAGYAIHAAPDEHTVLVKLWGFWPSEVCGSFSVNVLAACGAGKVMLVLDAADFKPQGEEAQAALGRVFGALPKLHDTRARVVVTNSLTKLQLLRLAKEQSALDLIQFTSKREAAP